MLSILTMNRLDELNLAIRTEKDLKVRTRLMAVHAVLELGHTTENMAAVFDVTVQCIVPDRVVRPKLI